MKLERVQGEERVFDHAVSFAAGEAETEATMESIVRQELVDAGFAGDGIRRSESAAFDAQLGTDHI